MTVTSQIVAEITGLPQDSLIVERPDSLLTPDAGTTTASRQTVFTGEAAKVAALNLKKQWKIKL